MREHGIIQPARFGNSFDAAAGECLAEEAGGELRRLFLRQRVEQPVADILFQEAAAFFDDDHVLAEAGEFFDELRHPPG